jgi:hypothetical protein
MQLFGLRKTPDLSSPAGSWPSSTNGLRPSDVRLVRTAHSHILADFADTRARHRLLKPPACGNAGGRWTCGEYSCAFYTTHTRLRVQRAAGIPHALKGGERFYARLGRIAPRGRETRVLPSFARSAATKQSTLSLRQDALLRGATPPLPASGARESCSPVIASQTLRMMYMRIRLRQKKFKSCARPPRAMVAYSIARNNPPATYILLFSDIAS